MANKSITAANANFLLSIASLFPIPQRLEGFATDDVFSTDAIQSAQTRMGVDGKLSGGFVFEEQKMMIALSPDSDSNDLFDQWWAQQQVNQEVFTASGLVTLFAIGQKWTLRKGFLTEYTPIPTAKKLLEPRKFGITWERIFPAIA